MAQQYTSPNANVAVAGATIVHNLTGGTPSRFWAQKMDGGTGALYFVGVSQTNVVVAANGVIASGVVYVEIPHTIVQ